MHTNMTEREISYIAIYVVYQELKLGLKKICVSEFGKPSDIIDRRGKPITLKRSWAQEELKFLYNIYNPEKCTRDKKLLAGPTDLSLLNDDELDVLYQSLLQRKIYLIEEVKIWDD